MLAPLKGPFPQEPADREIDLRGIPAQRRHAGPFPTRGDQLLAHSEKCAELDNS